MAQTQENTTEDKNTFIEASPVNDKAVKRLLRQKKPPSPYPTMRLEVIRRFKPERKDSYPNSVLKGFA